jgi:hypothetical protein
MISIGSINIQKIYRGASEVQKIYRGPTEIWSNFDPDASAYIALVESDLGTSLSLVRKIAIDNFYKITKQAGIYPLLKRVYLPIWANANANSICMISRTRGTFVGGVSHNIGSINSILNQNGYFDFGVSPLYLGMSQFNGGHFWAGSIQGGNVACIGTTISNNSSFLIAGDGPPNIGFRHLSEFNNNGRIFAPMIDFDRRTGIISAYGYDDKLSIYSRRTASRIVMISQARTGAGSVPTSNIWALRINGSSTWGWRTQPTYFFGSTLGLSDSQDAQLTLELKTLWETCTNLTLP